VGDLAVPAAEITSVDADAGTEDILRTAADHDRTRLLVRDRGTVLGSVHARDALVAWARGRTTTARTLARPVPELTEDTTVADAIDVLRKNRASLAVICDDTGRPTALVGPLSATTGGLTRPAVPARTTRHPDSPAQLSERAGEFVV
jgi:CBS domain containing-hemolysin-like protein